MTLRLEGVSVRYPPQGPGEPAVRAVVDLDLHLEAGRVLGLAGESGSGKSSLALTVLRLLPAHAEVGGRVLLEGEDVLRMTWGRLREVRWTRMAWIPQGAQHGLDPVRRVGAQVAAPILLHRRLDRAATRSSVHELLERVGLPDRAATAYPHELSGGQRQRALVAVALACEPRVLVADEPTTALDPASATVVLDLLTTAVRESGASLLLVSHDLSMLASRADHLAVMYAGRVVEQGPVRDVVRGSAHPYTRSLLTVGGLAGEPLEAGRPRSLLGAPPRRGQVPAGCAFAPRCPAAEDCCATDVPEQRQVSATSGTAGHLVACHRPHAAASVTAEALTAPSLGLPAVRRPLLRARDVTVCTAGPDRGVLLRSVLVRGVSLDVAEAEIVALVGPSGAGKTTLALALAGLRPIGGGRIELDGEPVTTGPRGRPARSVVVQYLPQDAADAIDPRHSVAEAVAEGLRIHRVPADSRPHRVLAALERVGLRPAEDFLPARASQLSTGQRQRVALAASLAVGPKLLVADEPTAGLDASARGDVLHLLLRLRAETGLAAVVITHDPAAVRLVADRTVTITGPDHV